MRSADYHELDLRPLHQPPMVSIRCRNPSDHELVWRPLLQGRDKAVVESLARWVEDEYQSKRQERVDTADWPRHYLRVRRNVDFCCRQFCSQGHQSGFHRCLSSLWAMASPCDVMVFCTVLKMRDGGRRWDHTASSHSIIQLSISGLDPSLTCAL